MNTKTINRAVRGLTQNPATERDDLFKIQQHGSKAGAVVSIERERERGRLRERERGREKGREKGRENMDEDEELELDITDVRVQ